MATLFRFNTRTPYDCMLRKFKTYQQRHVIDCYRLISFSFERQIFFYFLALLGLPNTWSKLMTLCMHFTWQFCWRCNQTLKNPYSDWLIWFYNLQNLLKTKRFTSGHKKFLAFLESHSTFILLMKSWIIYQLRRPCFHCHPFLEESLEDYPNCYLLLRFFLLLEHAASVPGWVRE